MNRPKILIVDDDPKLSGLMHAILDNGGSYEVREENRSFAALNCARAFRPDLVILDVDMPGKSGGDLRAELSGDPALSSVPVLFVTPLVDPWVAGGAAVIRSSLTLECRACAGLSLRMASSA